MKFGEYPIHISRNQEFGQYEVDPTEIEVASECGIPEMFTPDRLQVMEARAAAYGYVLVEANG